MSLGHGFSTDCIQSTWTKIPIHIAFLGQILQLIVIANSPRKKGVQQNPFRVQQELFSSCTLFDGYQLIQKC